MYLPTESGVSIVGLLYPVRAYVISHIFICAHAAYSQKNKKSDPSLDDVDIFLITRYRVEASGGFYNYLITKKKQNMISILILRQHN